MLLFMCFNYTFISLCLGYFAEPYNNIPIHFQHEPDNNYCFMTIITIGARYLVAIMSTFQKEQALFVNELSCELRVACIASKR